jgi:hemerythrin-like metal-binding protein
MTPENYIDQISKDHEELSGVLQTLRRVLDARDYGAARTQMLRLQQIEARHYATEDSLMRAVGYARAGEHRAEHGTLLDMLDRINRTLALESPDSISPKIVAHLEAAVAHMMDADEKLNRFVLERIVRS